MPFTFSHPAAIIPAKLLPKKWISITALIIGSITPDFEYFIRMKNYGIYGHTYGGIFWFDMPLGFALTFIYHSLVRDSLIDNLPRILRSRLIKFKGFDWNNYVKQNIWVVIVCLFAGILSHVVWDGFTHRTGYFVKNIPWLQRNTEINDLQHVRFYILQVISSFVGMLAVLIAILSMPRERNIERRKIVKYWAIATPIAIAIIAIRMMWYTYNPLDEVWVIHGIIIPDDIIMTAISACLMSSIITPFILRRRVQA